MDNNVQVSAPIFMIFAKYYSDDLPVHCELAQIAGIPERGVKWTYVTEAFARGRARKIRETTCERPG